MKIIFVSVFFFFLICFFVLEFDVCLLVFVLLRARFISLKNARRAICGCHHRFYLRSKYLFQIM